MNDLNDLYYFAAVVEHSGFASAERALGIPKSRLSRRISQLENDLGVRLLQRSTRRFAVTDVGQSVYRHAQSMLEEAKAAREVVDRLSAEPRGVIRVSVPVGIAQEHMPQAAARIPGAVPAGARADAHQQPAGGRHQRRLRRCTCAFAPSSTTTAAW